MIKPLRISVHQHYTVVFDEKDKLPNVYPVNDVLHVQIENEDTGEVITDGTCIENTESLIHLIEAMIREHV